MFQFLKSKIKTLSGALSKTASFFSTRLSSIFKKKLDEEQLEVLEELLYEADLGSDVVQHFIDKVEKYNKKNPSATEKDFLKVLEDTALEILDKKIPEKFLNKDLNKDIDEKTHKRFGKVIFVVGVNGSGKTTSIAKLGKKYVDEGKKVLFACGDTFRAAATEQLEIHAKNIGVDIVLSKQGADPGSVIFDAMTKGKSGYDVILCDTAGRLESKTQLLEELGKMIKVAKKIDNDAPHEILLTIDANLGQTCLQQVEKFSEFVPLTGLILTKIDSTAKGGVALSIYKKHEIPIKYIGYGETVCDFSVFEAKSYAKALFKA